MIKTYKENANAFIVLAVVIGLVGILGASLGVIGSGLAFILMVAERGLLCTGCYYYMKGKGWSGGFAIFGLLSVIGLLILVFFPDRSNRRKCLFCGSVLNEGATCCAKCGREQCAETLSCPHCGRPILVSRLRVGRNCCPYCKGVFETEA